MRSFFVAAVASIVGFGISSSTGQAAEVGNSVVTLSVSGTRGGSIDSFKVLGTETVDNYDLGREIQASLHFSYVGGTSACGPTYDFVNPQEAGDICGIASTIYALGTTGARLDVGTYPRDWEGKGVAPPGIRIEGHHTVGPLSYSGHPEVTQITYAIFSDQTSITPLHTFTDDLQHLVPVPLLPAMYFRGDTLTRLYGLSIDGTTWSELTSTVASDSNGAYHPSLYRFRAMAWMKPDLGWGVAIYGRWTLNQGCSSTFTMAISSQQGQCPNFAAEKFPNAIPGVVGGSNNLSLVDQTLSTIPAGTGVQVIAHLVVGNLGTLQSFINEIYDAGR